MKPEPHPCVEFGHDWVEPTARITLCSRCGVTLYQCLPEDGWTAVASGEPAWLAAHHADLDAYDEAVFKQVLAPKEEELDPPKAVYAGELKSRTDLRSAYEVQTPERKEAIIAAVVQAIIDTRYDTTSPESRAEKIFFAGIDAVSP